MNTYFRHAYPDLVVRLSIGGTFLVSAVSKLPHHTAFAAVVKDYGLLPDVLATAYANALPWTELLVGVYLLLGVLIKPSAFFAVLMAISFMVANVSAIARNWEGCGSCFGETLILPAWVALTIDVFLLFMAVYLLFRPGEPRVFSLQRVSGGHASNGH